ncbi:MAG TPA: ABC transporter ATP-binding protein [Myxococcota bacterium]|nr:ABC transporter ATP-binding protein [Myxococcota bacterium]
MTEDPASPQAARRILLEWILGSVPVDVPRSRLAEALKSSEQQDWDEWLVGAAETLGWEAERVEASPRAVTGERESWWVTCSTEGRERWLVLTGQRGQESIATLFDGWTARDVPMRAERLADAIGLTEEDRGVTWVRLTPAPVLEGLRSPADGPKLRPAERLQRWLGRERKTLIAVVAYSALIGVISLAIPLAVQSLVNSLAFGRVLQPLIVLSLALLLLLSLAAALRVLEVYIVELLQRRVFVDVARDVARRLPAALPEAGGPWGLTERINRFFDVVGAQKSSSFLLLNATEIVMSTVAGLLVLAFYHPYLLIFDIVLVIALGIVLFRLGRGGVETAVEESHAKYDLAAWLESIARRQQRFASPEGAAWGTRQTERRIVDWLTRRAHHFDIVLRQTIGFATIQALSSASLLGLGGFLVWDGQISLGQLVASELIITGVMAQLAKFGKHVESFYDLNASVEKLGMLLDLETEPTSGELLEKGETGIAVELQDLALQGSRCTLSIGSGDRVGLARLPHRARRDLFDVIYGTRTPESGNVLLDGAPVTSLAPRTRRHQIALVRGGLPVSGTLEDNLTSGDARATAGQIRRLLEEVGLGSMLSELPDGLETWIHPDGDPLDRSQLIALDVARALLRGPRLLLVDHALDRVGNEHLEPLLAALTRPEAPWTLLIASDRPEVLERCARVHPWTEQGLHNDQGDEGDAS